MHWRWGQKDGEAYQVVSYRIEDETVKLVLQERRASGNPQRGYLLPWLERPPGSQEMSVGFRGCSKEINGGKEVQRESTGDGLTQGKEATTGIYYRVQIRLANWIPEKGEKDEDL